VRRTSISSTQNEAYDRALQTWRRQSVDVFCAKHGERDESGVRRKSLVENAEGELVDEKEGRCGQCWREVEEDEMGWKGIVRSEWQPDTTQRARML
jgi:hypothetical protein